MTPHEMTMPLVVTGPWTSEAKLRAINKDVGVVFVNYFRDALKVRNWIPWDDLPLKQMQEYGHLLSPDTITIILAYLGVEDYVGDYVEDGLSMLNGQRERRNSQLVWGMEELKHAEAWALVLLHSGAKTQQQIDDYRDEVSAHKWTMRENHPGLDSPLGLLVYAMFQERATYFNYDQMRKRIRSEYGLPETATKEERGKNLQIGAAGAFQIVSRDEIAHHGIFREVVRIHMRYQPAATLEMIQKVLSGFTMPALYLIPNAVDLEQAMRRTKLHTPRNQVTEVNNPILESLGIGDRRNLERLIQQARMLPDGLGPEHVIIGETGELVLSMTPQDALTIEA